ncbi:hypothetical protein FHX57_006686, partial [Paraburkholderia tropica]|nr:hypothetical protein [Paraburkholderia tropica]
MYRASLPACVTRLTMYRKHDREARVRAAQA